MMRTVQEVSRLTGVSARTLRYYDKIGLLCPAQVTKSGYRLYDEANLERLQLILLYRELQFPLKEIKAILDRSDFDRNRILEQQIILLKMQKEHLENLITLAYGITALGVKNLDFTAFDTSKIDEYAAQAKLLYGQTAAYHEFEEKSKDRSPERQQEIATSFMDLFVEFGALRPLNHTSDQVQKQVKKLQDFITEHYYTCTKEVLQGLGIMYSEGGRFAENIDKAGGEGTAVFTAKAIDYYCQSQSI